MEDVLLLIKALLIMIIIVLCIVDSLSFLFCRDIKDGVGAILWILILLFFK